ncbi:hypothetical protein ERJ75_001355600 [Trypanosoma vivax]|uniref:Uncharacterized protein n=1 Tax=Trypanosoma vivax (strain Y486) TaxID=1055687 RepID=G0UCT6_TRYVY|nr:hypothetical protein TRVL_02336 [Trypanosoma vivax]KAH8608110.1 hypothetical protein ERJ75_001355600 [Trypanosoma vivax]CCC53646.1 conserved hypothetical protein [Trypanosoma vivax Y486]
MARRVPKAPARESPNNIRRPTCDEVAFQPLSERETAELFLSDIGRYSFRRINAEEVCDAPDNAPARGPRHKKTKKASTKDPARRVSGRAVARSVGEADHLVLPLEEGEEDPSLSMEVVKQVSGFLSSLKPARSRQFWALRRLARGESTGEEVAAAKAAADVEEEYCDGEEFSDNLDTSDEDGESGDTSNTDGSSNISHANSSPKRPEMMRGVPTPEQLKGMKNTKTAGKKRSGGTLFGDNHDIWED